MLIYITNCGELRMFEGEGYQALMHFGDINDGSLVHVHHVEFLDGVWTSARKIDGTPQCDKVFLIVSFRRQVNRFVVLFNTDAGLLSLHCDDYVVIL